MAASKTEPKMKKVYYSIKEVAEMFSVNESLLRYWEKAFPHIRPHVGSNNVRQYTEKDIEKVATVYNLVKVRGFKLDAARKMFNENREGVDKTTVLLDTLISVRDELLNLRQQLDRLS